MKSYWDARAGTIIKAKIEGNAKLIGYLDLNFNI